MSAPDGKGISVLQPVQQAAKKMVRACDRFPCRLIFVFARIVFKQNSENHMNKLATCVASTVLCFAAGSAFAGEAVKFQWSPSELRTLEGIEATHERVIDLAREVCRVHLRGTRGISRTISCVGAVADEIVERVNDQRLTAYATTGRVSAELLASR
jgi:UrcA family protein